MRLLQIGLGDFGMSWFKNVLTKNELITELILCDTDVTRLHTAEEFAHMHSIPCDFHLNLTEALETKPDCVLNVLPPHLHKDTTLKCIEAGIPVLLEKPIALNLDDAQSIYKASRESKVPVIIAQNYRYMPVFRFVKEKMDSGLIGNLQFMDIRFAQMHNMSNYHKDLGEPLLLDVSIHHLDAIRYLTDDECSICYGESYNPYWSHYKGNANVRIMLKSQRGVGINYQGTLVSRFPDDHTGWIANWIIEGDRGRILIENDKVYFQLADCDAVELDYGEISDGRDALLMEFINSVQLDSVAETDISDNINTFQLATDVLS